MCQHQKEILEHVLFEVAQREFWFCKTYFDAIHTSPHHVRLV